MSIEQAKAQFLIKKQTKAKKKKYLGAWLK
jgi:hypothetical protein